MALDVDTALLRSAAERMEAVAAVLHRAAAPEQGGDVATTDPEGLATAATRQLLQAPASAAHTALLLSLAADDIAERLRGAARDFDFGEGFGGGR